MEKSAEGGDEQIKNGESPRSDKKTPRRRLIQSTLFPLKSQEKAQENNNNGQGKEDEDEEHRGSGIQSNNANKRKRKPKIASPPVKTPTKDPEALGLKIESKNSSLTVDELGVVNGDLPPEKKTPCQRLVQSTLIPHQENALEDKNEDDNKEDEEYCGSPSKGKRKRKPKEQTGHTPCAKTPINNQESLTGGIESKSSMLTNGLQSNLMEKSAEAEKIVAVNGDYPHSEKRTPRRRLVQSTLLPHNSQENGEENNNGEEDEEDGKYCESQSKGKGKRKGKAKTKRTPTKTPDNSQEALEGKNSLLSNERQIKQKQKKDQKVADSPDGNGKPCKDLESGPCKRSRRQLKKGQSDDSPRKVPTPSKLKGPHCRRIMTDFNELQSERAREPIDLRLEAKLAAEENARLFAGRPTHPFFSSWKVGKKIQGTLEATDVESGRCSIVHEDLSRCRPIHVFEILQDDPVPLDWSNWSFCDESSLDSSYNPENACSSSFNSSVEALKLDDFPITSDPVGASFLQNGNSLNYSYSNYLKSPAVRFIDGGVSLHQSEQLETGQEMYPINSMGIEQRDSYVEERVKRYYRECGPENSLWTNKYLPRNASEVCGNGESVRYLNEWLGSWRERYSRNPNNYTGDNTCVTEAIDYSSEESDSDAKSTEERANLMNVLLVSGPIGSGKSAAIYACAREQGFQVIEVSASDWRNGAHIKQKFGAAMESLGLNRWSAEEPLGLGMKHILGSTRPSNLSIREFDDGVVEVLSETCKEESDSFKPEPDIIDVKDNLTTTSRGADKTLILFEDVDTVFDEDRGLIASIQQIAETAKRPIILTSNRKDPVLPDQLDRLEVCFTIPSPEDLVSHIHTVCASEKAELHPELLRRFIKCCQGDIRKSIMLLQFWCQGKMDEKDRKVQSKYGPRRFDLDAGHQVIPNVIPWGFPCQLSELVEKEITKSLSKVNDNASLPDIVEEEDFSSQEMQDAVEAKKKLLLSRNSSIPDGNGFSVQLDCLDDFSNSSGSPVAFTRGPARRKLCRVLSSQSEDEFSTDNIPKDSNAQSVDLCNGVFPDVSHTPLADTTAAHDYRHPPTGQPHHCEKEISIQEFFDCFPTETDQQICETYKSVDISCVPESLFVPETEINDGMELVSNTVSCGRAAVTLDTMAFSTARSVESISIIDASGLHETMEGSETILGNTCEADAISVQREEIGDSQHEHAESITRRYQALDECSRAGFNLSSLSSEYPRCIPDSGSVPETWRRLRCCHADLKSYVTLEQRNASHIVKLASGMTDLISLADLMFTRCQPLISDLLESSMVPYAETDALSWYDEHVEMASTIMQHGFCFFAKESVARGSNLGLKVGVDLASELVSSTTNTTLLGKLLTNSSSASHNSFSRKNFEIRLSRGDISLKREIENRFYNMIQNVVPSKMYLALKGGAFHEYMSSLSQISRSEASRLSENIDKTKLGRRGRVARHYLSNGSLMLSPEDVTLLAQHSCFGKL